MVRILLPIGRLALIIVLTLFGGLALLVGGSLVYLGVARWLGPETGLIAALSTILVIAGHMLAPRRTPSDPS